MEKNAYLLYNNEDAIILQGMTALIPYLSSVFIPVAPKSGATYNGLRKNLTVKCFLTVL